MSPTTPTLHPGDQLVSTACGTKVIVIRAPAQGAPVVGCAGVPMVPASSAVPKPPEDGGPPVTLLGKRYVHEASGLELLCTSPGSGELTCDGIAMTLKAARALPASD